MYDFSKWYQLALCPVEKKIDKAWEERKIGKILKYMYKSYRIVFVVSEHVITEYKPSLPAGWAKGEKIEGMEGPG